MSEAPRRKCAREAMQRRHRAAQDRRNRLIGDESEFRSDEENDLLLIADYIEDLENGKLDTDGREL